MSREAREALDVEVGTAAREYIVTLAVWYREHARPDEAEEAVAALDSFDALAAELAAARTRETELREALPSSDRLFEIADILDLFDRVVELADVLLPGEREHYHAVDHTAMQDDLRQAATALASATEGDAE